MEGNRDGPHLVKSSGESKNEESLETKDYFEQITNQCAHLLSVLILALHTEQVVSRCVPQLQPHYTRLHHDVVPVAEVT